ncbi:MAG TPA: hypothetical protein VNQ77_02265 [Frankiaceae bacterium]|nr:hypothetical protein [Frankiaceae bacterium]
MKRRVMYIEHKGDEHDERGEAWIGWVTFSKTGRTVYTRGLRLQRVRGVACGNAVDLDTGETYWISGPKKDGCDRLYGNAPVEVEADAREEYRRLTGR